MVSIDGPEVLLEPNSAQAIAVTLHELATTCMLPSMATYFLAPKVRLRSSGRHSIWTPSGAFLLPFGRDRRPRPTEGEQTYAPGLPGGDPYR